MNVSEWVCVPREATKDMARAGVDAGVAAQGRRPWFPETYRAAIAAAPTPAPVPVDPAEIEALRRDAARYRWLRNKGMHALRDDLQTHVLYRSDEYMDRVIDGYIKAALAANEEKVE